MSLLNDMLHDLEKRTAIEERELAEVYPLFIEPNKMESPADVRVGWNLAHWGLMVGAALTLGAALWFFYFTNSEVENRRVENRVKPLVSTTPIDVTSNTGVKVPVELVTSSDSPISTWPDKLETRYFSLASAGSQHTMVEDGAVEKPAAKVKPHPIAVPPPLKNDKSREPAILSKVRIKPPSAVMIEKLALSEAKSLIYLGKRHQAKSRLARLLERLPAAKDAHLVLSGWVVQDNEWTHASRLLADVDRNSDQRLRILKARTLLEQKQPGKALEIMLVNRPALEQVPEFHALLAALYQRTGKFRESVSVYSRLTQFEQARGDWWGGLAIGLDQSGDKMKALAAYRQALNSIDIQQNLKLYARKRITMLSRLSG